MKTHTEPNDIDAKSVEFSLRMYEQAAVDREYRRRHLREFNERAAREAFVARIVAQHEPHPYRLTTLEVYCFAACALASVAVIAFALCEIVRLVKTYGF